MLMDNEKISTRQAIVFLISVAVGVGILSLPRQVDEKAGQDGWISIIIGGLFTLIGSIIVAAVVSRQKKDVVKITEDLMGKFASIVVGMFYIVYFIVMAAVVNQTFAEVANLYLLENTPKEFTIITMLLLVFYACRIGIEPTVRAIMILFPFATFLFIFIIFTCLSRAKIDEILPFFSTPVNKIFTASFESLFSLEGFELLLVLGPYLRRPEKAKKIVIIYTEIVTFFYVFITLVTFMVLGKNETKLFKWPVFMMIKGITAPGEIFERMDAISISIWVIEIFTTVVAYYFAEIQVLKSLSGLKEQRYVGGILFPLFYFITNMPKNFTENQIIAGFANYLIYPAAFIIPLLLYIISIFKKRGEES